MKKILWVEDDAFLSSIVEKKFSTETFTLLIARDGQQAFQILETETPDIIILDILLPGMDGFEILKKIREKENFKTTPVVLLSNVGAQADIDKGIALGATKYMVKASYTLDQIIDEVKKILEPALVS